MRGKAKRLIEDVRIAATARIQYQTIAIRNEKDLRQLGVQVLDPFKTPR